MYLDKMYNINSIKNRKYNYNNQMYTSEQINENNQNQNKQNKIFNDYKFNIFWMLYIILNFIIGKYLENTLEFLSETDECSDYYDCNVILSLLIDKNDYLFGLILTFGFIQMFILILSFFSNKIKHVNEILSIFFGLVYLTTSLWKYSILFSYHYNIDFYYTYRFYMRDSEYFDTIRLSTYYYLFGETIGFMINFLLVVPLLFILFFYFVLSVLNLFYPTRKF